MTDPKARRKRKLLLSSLLLLAFLIVAGVFFQWRFLGSTRVWQTGVAADAPASLAAWPWPKSKHDQLHRGVTHWYAAQDDGTVVDVFEFDFAANPRLRLELFDQDSDDEKPFDDKARYWERGVAQIVPQLNRKFAGQRRGKVVAAWNGLFFGYMTRPIGPGALAKHVSPVVTDGKVRYTSMNHRWSFGVKATPSGPQFKMFHLPEPKKLGQEIDFGGGSAQCMIRDGKPLKLQPFPKQGDPPVPQPVPSTPLEAGHIPIFDHMRTCRTSLGWSKDNKRLYLLFVKEPDTEAGSKVVLKHGLPVSGGWTVPDVQRFWQGMVKDGRVWNAINSDAGDLAQLAYLRPAGNYMLVPARWTGVTYDRKVFPADFKGAPAGGALMYFYIREDGEPGAKKS